MPRWTVTTRDDLEDVGADYASVMGGALVFTNKDGHMLVAYAPNTWLIAIRDEDED